VSAFNAALHPRGAKGTATGGQFISEHSNASANAAAAGAKKRLGNTLSKTSIEAYQKKHGLHVDGLVGHQTAEALLGYKHASRVKVGALTSAQRKALAKVVGK
jgi:murein L,D-transpeptidase YcbB/YkuD